MLVVLFEPENGLEAYFCAWCGGGFQEVNGRGLGYIPNDLALCCSEACAQMRSDDLASRFVMEE